MSCTEPTRETIDALVAESRLVRAETYALLDALRAANRRLQELVAAQARVERVARSQLRSTRAESALDRLKMAILAEPKQWPAWLPQSIEAVVDNARTWQVAQAGVMRGAPDQAGSA